MFVVGIGVIGCKESNPVGNERVNSSIACSHSIDYQIEDKEKPEDNSTDDGQAYSFNNEIDKNNLSLNQDINSERTTSHSKSTASDTFSSVDGKYFERRDDGEDNCS